MDIYIRIKRVFGSKSELARQIGTTSSVVQRWQERGRIPAERCKAIVSASNGKITLHDLRPDLWDA